MRFFIIKMALSLLISRFIYLSNYQKNESKYNQKNLSFKMKIC